MKMGKGVVLALAVFSAGEGIVHAQFATRNHRWPTGGPRPRTGTEEDTLIS